MKGSFLSVLVIIGIFLSCEGKSPAFDKDSACECNPFIDGNGYGNCETVFKRPPFRGALVCWVNIPTSCSDFRPPIPGGKQILSAEACKVQRTELKCYCEYDSKSRPTNKIKCGTDGNCTLNSFCESNEICNGASNISDAVMEHNKKSLCGNRNPCLTYGCYEPGICEVDLQFRPKCKCPSGYGGAKCQYHYVVKENEWCDATNKDLYRKSLQDAQRNCFDDVTCTMFYDFKSEKNSFTACKYREYAGHNGINSAPIISESSLNSSLYIKCTSETIFGPDKAKKCHLPFNYKNVTHHKCIETDSPRRPWCATEKDYTPKTFGYCNCPSQWKRKYAGDCNVIIDDGGGYGSTNYHRQYLLCNQDIRCSKITEYHTGSRPSYSRCTLRFTYLPKKGDYEYIKPENFFEGGSNNDTTTKSTIDSHTAEPKVPTNDPDKPLAETGFWVTSSWRLVVAVIAPLVIFLTLYYSCKQSTTEWQAFVKFTTITFRLACFFLALYTAYTQLLNYLKNSDASSVTFRRFMEQPKDQYPTFTFCFADSPEAVYSDATKELDMSKDEYSNILKGKTNVTEEKLQRAVENINKKFSMQLQNILRKIDFETKDPDKSFSVDKSTSDLVNWRFTDLPFYISHQDPDRICFTRKEDVETGQDFLRIEDRIDFETTYLKGVHFLLYAHYPGQFTRYIQRPIFEMNFKRTLTQLSANVAYVGVLRKRPESNVPCNPSLKDDDDEFKLRVIKDVGCIPPYWKFMVKTEADLCRTSNQLKDVYHHIKHPAGIMKQYNPPCDEMQIPVNVKEFNLNGRKITGLEFTMRYTTEIYQEIENFRDYNLDTLWSSVGGFVGIFLGYSLLQLPELLQIDWNSHWNIMFGKRNVNPRLALLLHKRN